MSTPTPNSINKDVRTTGYVLRRTNYGEADRILNLITPQGKFAVIAKGVRKSRSKLAGGIEMFTLSDFNIHFGRGEFGTLTGAKMLSSYHDIIKDFTRMELAALVFKKISLAADSSDSPAYFHITDQALAALDSPITDIRLIAAWFRLNLVKAAGDQINLYRDSTGTKLTADTQYDWDIAESCFVLNPSGPYGTDEIKLLRLLLSADLTLCARVKLTDYQLDQTLHFSQIIAKF